MSRSVIRAKLVFALRILCFQKVFVDGTNGLHGNLAEVVNPERQRHLPGADFISVQEVGQEIELFRS